MEDELEGVFPLHQPTFIPCSCVCVCVRPHQRMHVCGGGAHTSSPLDLDLFNICLFFILNLYDFEGILYLLYIIHAKIQSFHRGKEGGQ